MSDFSACWPAPAKLNLFLHITGRRDDGYHLLQSVFQFLDYGDTLRFTPRDDDLISEREPLAGVNWESNLIYKAAQLLRPRARRFCGVTIGLDKRLPMGGGIGGGSSDAATTLYALNHLWDCGLNEDELAALGLTLGADVPVFIRGRAAWAEGVGENLTAVDLPEPWFAVIYPGVEIPTPKIFCHDGLTRDCRALTIRDFLAGAPVSNVCEPVAKKLYPAVAKAIDFLDNTAPSGVARMTGTGSCVFAAYPDRSSAEKAVDRLPAPWRGFAAKSCNRSPLLEVVK
ncbi:4-(cytidine 5'-diphospho)-2-C-methyl-D-erythritol kinase [Granulosicoccaceae sp. 1_MG-2023]|nr:4-(cytidine 5'-diphospho)-2-C-methyl-D-erythritol kinase [Granulosicoccaceae sp. 1_MG-2023]